MTASQTSRQRGSTSGPRSDFYTENEVHGIIILGKLTVTHLFSHAIRRFVTEQVHYSGLQKSKAVIYKYHSSSELGPGYPTGINWRCQPHIRAALV